MRTKELIGKKVIDSAGDDLGEVEDIELNWETKIVNSIIVSGDHEIKQKFLSSKYAKKIFGRVNAKADPDIIISVNDIEVIGNVIRLSIDVT